MPFRVPFRVFFMPFKGSFKGSAGLGTFQGSLRRLPVWSASGRTPSFWTSSALGFSLSRGEDGLGL